MSGRRGVVRRRGDRRQDTFRGEARANGFSFLRNKGVIYKFDKNCAVEFNLIAGET